MTAVHIYTAKSQPATRFTDDNGDTPMSFWWPANRLLWCGCCRKLRPAKNVVVQCYYDGINCWCAPDKGCKHPQVVAAKRRTEFRNRSAGQKARYQLRTP